MQDSKFGSGKVCSAKYFAEFSIISVVDTISPKDQNTAIWKHFSHSLRKVKHWKTLCKFYKALEIQFAWSCVCVPRPRPQHTHHVTCTATSRYHLHLEPVTPATVPRSDQEHTHRSHSHPTLFTLEVLEAIWRQNPTSQQPEKEDHTQLEPLSNPFNTPLWRFKNILSWSSFSLVDSESWW